MKAFSESTIILGSGFSDHYWENADGHVGYQNLLFNTGIIGAFIFLLITIKMLLKVYSKRLPYDNNKLAILPLILLLIINTGTQTIGFTIGAERMILNAFAVVLIYNEKELIYS